eukprot:m.177200 g.177200  ORF g.177200 m.177200 type:complete len:252 (+) comp24475_c0_seq4:21-776(+)
MYQRKMQVGAVDWVALVVLVMGIGVDAGCTVDRSTLKCYTDFTPPPPGHPRVRVLGPPVYTGKLTWEYCAQVCHDHTQPLAGVENGNNCMCGKAVVPPAAPLPKGCNGTARMSGNQSEQSGDAFEILTFGFACSGSPVPPPAPPPPPPPPTPSGPCATFNDPNCSWLFNPCLDSALPYHAMPFCDPARSIGDRAADMVGRMTLAEKIESLDNSADVGTHSLIQSSWPSSRRLLDLGRIRISGGTRLRPASM